MKGGGDLGDLELQSTTSVFTKRRTVIRTAASCNRLSGERGAGGPGWCVGGSGVGGGGGARAKNVGIDDEFMHPWDGSCNL